MSIKAVAVIAGETVKGVIHFEQEVILFWKLKNILKTNNNSLVLHNLFSRKCYLFKAKFHEYILN